MSHQPPHAASAALDALLTAACNFSEVFLTPAPRSAADVATLCDLALRNIVKTLVIEVRGQQPVVCCVCGDEQLDLKTLARTVGCGIADVSLMRPDRLRSVLGLQPGAVTPFGLPPSVAVFVSERLQDSLDETISVGSGEPGKGYLMSARSLTKITNAVILKEQEPRQ